MAVSAHRLQGGVRHLGTEATGGPALKGVVSLGEPLPPSGTADPPRLPAQASSRQEQMLEPATVLTNLEEWVSRHEAALNRIVSQQKHLEDVVTEATETLVQQLQVKGEPGNDFAVKGSNERFASNPGSRADFAPRHSNGESGSDYYSAATSNFTNAASKESSTPGARHRRDERRKRLSGTGSGSKKVRSLRSVSSLFGAPPKKRPSSRSPTLNLFQRGRQSVTVNWENTIEYRRFMCGLTCPLTYCCAVRVQLLAKALSNNGYFNLLCFMLILANAVLVGIETDVQSAEQGGDYDYDELQLFEANAFFVMQTALNVWYILELLVRCVADGCSFFTSKEWRWNLFDAALVGTSLLDLFASTLSVGGLQMGRVFRAVRLMRVVRTLRIVRVMHYIQVFRKMIFSILESVQTLFWSLLLLFFLLYTYAIWFTQGVKEMLRKGDHSDFEDLLRQYYGTLGRSFYSLLLAMLNGRSWGYVAEPLFETDSVLFALFLSYILITLLGVLNVVTSIFVDSAMQSTQHYKDLIVQEKLNTKDMFIKHVKDIFNQIDTDKSGSISAEELRKYIQDEDLQLHTYFEALELNPSDTRALFKLLDPTNSGEIDIEEFCDGCVKLHGSARSFDVNCIMYEQRRQTRQQRRFMEDVRKSLNTLAGHTEFVERAILKVPNRGATSPPQRKSIPNSDGTPAAYNSNLDKLDKDVWRPSPRGVEGGLAPFTSNAAAPYLESEGPEVVDVGSFVPTEQSSPHAGYPRPVSPLSTLSLPEPAPAGRLMV